MNDPSSIGGLLLFFDASTVSFYTIVYLRPTIGDKDLDLKYNINYRRFSVPPTRRPETHYK